MFVTGGGVADPTKNRFIYKAERLFMFLILKRSLCGSREGYIQKIIVQRDQQRSEYTGF